MDERSAAQLAEILDGETWQSGGGQWLVLKRRADGRIVVFSDEAVAVYSDTEEMQVGQPETSILIV